MLRGARIVPFPLIYEELQVCTRGFEKWQQPVRIADRCRFQAPIYQADAGFAGLIPGKVSENGTLRGTDAAWTALTRKAMPRFEPKTGREQRRAIMGKLIQQTRGLAG